MPAQNKDDGGWKKFLWNSDTREFLGRTGGSWAKILLFYVLFYGFLAGIFSGTIQALLLTLNKHKPTWQDRITPPGVCCLVMMQSVRFDFAENAFKICIRLTHSPRTEKTELSFTMNDPTTYLKSVKSMKEFLKAYNDETQRNQLNFEDCGEQPDVYKIRGELEDEMGTKKACRFPKSILGPCSGTDDQYFGFSEGRPCLIVKLNRIVNFRPKPPQSNDSIPEEAKSKVQPNVIPLHCTSKKKEEEDLLGQVSYYGIGGGFPLQYYPYYGRLLHPHYLQPLVAIQFINITMNQEIRVECKVYGENILYSDKDRYQGRFEVKIKVNNF